MNPRTYTKSWMRNYGAMGDDKLARCIKELERGINDPTFAAYDDAYDRCIDKGGNPTDHLYTARYHAQKRGVAGHVDVAAPSGPIQMCPECNKKGEFYDDMDYICRKCRDALTQEYVA